MRKKEITFEGKQRVVILFGDEEEIVSIDWCKPAKSADAVLVGLTTQKKDGTLRRRCGTIWEENSIM